MSARRHTGTPREFLPSKIPHYHALIIISRSRGKPRNEILLSIRFLSTQNGVSWIRRWDWQILSAGVYMQIHDDRFSVLHKDGSENWTLQIKYVAMSDKGTYECQV